METQRPGVGEDLPPPVVQEARSAIKEAEDRLKQARIDRAGTVAYLTEIKGRLAEIQRKVNESEDRLKRREVEILEAEANLERVRQHWTKRIQEDLELEVEKSGREAEATTE